MGLNGYVLPISAFLAGDYVSLTVKLGGETLIRRRDTPAGGIPVPGSTRKFLRRVIPDDPAELRARALRVQQARSRAVEAVTKIKQEVTRNAGVTADWNETGGTQYEHPIYKECLAALRQYAKDADGFYPHLCDHSLKGFFVPIGFARPFTTEETVVTRKVIDVGSSNALYDELMQLNRQLRIEARWDALRNGEVLESTDPAKTGWAILESLSRRSVEALTPICLDE